MDTDSEGSSGDEFHLVAEGNEDDDVEMGDGEDLFGRLADRYAAFAENMRVMSVLQKGLGKEDEKVRRMVGRMGRRVGKLNERLGREYEELLEVVGPVAERQTRRASVRHEPSGRRR